MSRYRDPQPQVLENYCYLFLCNSFYFNLCFLRRIKNTFHLWTHQSEYDMTIKPSHQTGLVLPVRTINKMSLQSGLSADDNLWIFILPVSPVQKQVFKFCCVWQIKQLMDSNEWFSSFLSFFSVYEYIESYPSWWSLYLRSNILTLKTLKYFCINHGDERVSSIWSHHKWFIYS